MLLSTVALLLACLGVPLLIIGLVKYGRFFLLAIKIPTPVKIPLLGEFLLMIRHRFNLVTALELVERKYGPIFRLWGRNLSIIVTSSEFLEIVFTHPSLQNRSTEMDGVQEISGREGLFTVNAEKAKEIKKVFIKSFNTTSSKNNIESYRKDTNGLIQTLKKESSKAWLEMLPIIEKATTSSIARSALEADVKEYPQLLEQISKLKLYQLVMIRRGFSPIHQIDFLYKYVFGGNDFHKFIETTHNFTYECIAENKRRLAGMMKNGSEIPNKFIFNLLRERPNASDNVLLQDILAVILGALDTTAKTIAFTLTMLGIHQNIQEKVYEEDKRIICEMKGEELEDQDFWRYDYLVRVIKETLRLYPPVPLSPREVLEDVQFGKYILPKGSSVVASIISVHRDPLHYPEPSKFDPDRFLQDNVVNRSKFTYLPFGSGQRNCPGFRYANQFSIYMVAGIIRNFKVFTKYQSVPDLDKNLNVTISLNTKDGFPMRFERR